MQAAIDHGDYTSSQELLLLIKESCKAEIEENFGILIDFALRGQISMLSQRKTSAVRGEDLFGSYPGVRQMIAVRRESEEGTDRVPTLLPKAKLRQIDEWLSDGSRLTTRRSRNPGIAAMLRDAYSVEKNPEATLEDALRKFRAKKDETG